MSEPDGVLFFADVAELRAWLPTRGGDEAWLGFPRTRYGVARTTTLTVAAVAAELAGIGWVEDGRGAVDDDRYAVHFAPGTVGRTRAPAWSWDGGQAEVPELSEVYADEFRANAEAWAWFEKQPPRYRRTAIWWVMSGKAEETRRRRLTALVEGSAAGERLAQLQRQM